MTARASVSNIWPSDAIWQETAHLYKASYPAGQERLHAVDGEP